MCLCDKVFLNRIKSKNLTFFLFFSFPKDRNLMNKWIMALNQTNFEPNIWNKVCSVHFLDSNFYETKKGLRKLISTAVPALFLETSISESDHNLTETASLNSGKVTVPALHEPSTSNDIQMNSEVPSNVYPLLPNIGDTPRKRKLRKEIIRLKDVAKRRRLRCNALYATRRRLKKKIETLSQVLNELQEKRLITQEQVDLLESCGVSAKALIKRMIHKGKQYSPELRTFALTLQFYSPKAYSYVRSTFNSCLPHPNTIRKWYQCFDANPGFTAEAFNALREKVKANENKIVCNLVTDEMSIRKLKEFDGNNVQGYVDFGVGIDVPGDTSVLCTQALVFLLVALNGGWKLPVGYFLVDGVTGEQRANLVRMCLSNCHEVGIEVVSMTFDGCPANIAMARELGCSFNLGQLKTYFPHPETQQPIYVFLDPCHMVKLIRNTLESKKVFQDNSGGLIKWQYFVELNTLQENEKFHLANKLTTRHIDFKNQVMKVKLAVQLLSASVAKAIQFCDQKLHFLNFANSAATVNFIHVINNLFDMLNSRKFPGIDFKAPINEKNETKYTTFLENAKTYLQMLVFPNDNQQIVCSRNKIGFLGLCVCIESMKHLYDKLVKQEKKMSFVPMYKLSQDHLEILFSVIRSHGGFNNNPSASQFKAIYKKLLVHMELKENFTGNCTPLEQITLLTCSSSADHINQTTKGHRSASHEDDTMVDEQFMSNLEDDINLPTALNHSVLSQHVISYIAGFVTRYLLSKIECTECLSALVAKTPSQYNSFILFKDRGGLIYPSKDVTQICSAAEKVVKCNLQSKHRADRDPRSMITKTLKLFIGTDIFNVLHPHLYEQEPCSNHLLHLIRAVIQKYIQIRVRYLVRKSNIQKTKRQLYNKLTLFSGQ